MLHPLKPFTKIIKTRATRTTLPRAFTLIELMLSITLVLVLMLGVNYIFRTTTDAVGAGQTINTIARDSQSSQTLLFDDFRNASKDPPCFIIASQIVPQFLNTDDAQTGTDPTQYPADVTPPPHPNLGSVLPTVNTTEALYNYRFHRCDLLKFFAHGPYTRHTANDGAYTSSTTSEDAFITIGHALLPTYDHTMYIGPTSDAPSNSGIQINHLIQVNQSNNPTNSTGTVPPWSVLVEVPPSGGGLNPNPLAVQRVGSYATDWVLAKNVTLLKDPNSLLTTPGQPWSITGGTPNPYLEHNFVRQPNVLQAPTATYNNYTANMTPLGFGSLDDTSAASPVPTTPPPWPIQSSRYDLAGITPDQFRRAIADEILQWAGNTVPGPYTGGHLWWNPLIYNCPAVQNTGDPTKISQTTTIPIVPYVTYSATADHYPNYQFTSHQSTDSSGVTLNTLATPTGPDLARSACNPLLSTPLTSAAVAQMSPYFLQHCSQFIVEYAGDYLTQDNTTDANAGSITALGSDGVIDYYFDANKNKRIRWYGMPRSTTNNGHIMGVLGAGTFPNRTIPVGTANDTPDVIPLRDYYAAILNDVTAAPPWEVDVNFDIPAALNAALPGDYVNPVAPGGGTGLLFAQTPSASNTAFVPSRYACAWYNDMPAMVRILIKVDDPNNKLKDGPWYEYVFKLK